MYWLTGVVIFVTLLLILTLWLGDRLYLETSRHHKTKQALEASESRARLMADNAAGIVLAYDMDRKLTFATPAVEKLTGYSAEDLRDEGLLAWVHTEDRRRMRAHWESLFRGGACLDEEYRLVTRNGRVKWMSATWSPVLDEQGRQTGIQGSEREITARKYAEQALQESERRFRDLMDCVQFAAVMVNVKGYVSFCNEYALNLTGWTRDDVIGHPACQFFDPEFRQQLVAAIELAQETGEPQTPYESAILTRDRERRWFQWSSIALRDTLGKTVGFASVGADITARKETRPQRNETPCDPRLVSVVAHDFNNLLAVIHACGDLIGDRLADGDPAREAVEEIRRAGKRGFQLTQQLFALSQTPHHETSA